MAKAKPRVKANPIWDDVIADLKGLADTLKKGGVNAAAERYTVRQLVVAPPPDLTAEQVRAARDEVRLSQAAFARFLGVGVSLVRAWEGGTRSPKGADRRLLADVLAHPDHWRERVREAVALAS